MNKFTEQNKAVEKSDTQAKTNKNGSATATTTETSQMGKAATADKAKVTAAPQQLTETAKKDAFNGKWHSQIQAAKSNWSKISESELLKSGGVETNLTDLVQQRYSLSQDTASKQVKSFIDKCHC
jgi:hypothetical protein